MITHRISSLSLKGYGGENDKKPVPARPEAPDRKDGAEELIKHKNKHQDSAV